MPYFSDFGDEDDDEKKKDPNSLQLAGAGETASNAGNQMGGLKPTQEVNSGSGFQNLDKYINASKTGNFGDQFLAKVGGGVNAAYDKKNAASDQFKKQVDQANTLPSDSDLQGVIANPTAEGAADKYKGWIGQSYKGPKDLAENKDVWNKYWEGINGASAPTEQLGTEHGRHTLLDSYFGRPGYSAGEKNLDHLILSHQNLGPGVKDLQSKVSSLKQAGKSGEDELKKYASNRSQVVGLGGGKARDLIGINDKNQVIQGDKAGALGKEYAAVEARQKQLNDERKAAQGGLSQGLTSGNLTPEQLGKIGLSGNENAYNLDLNSYLSNAGDVSKEQAITPENKARLKALSSLAGIEDTYAGDPQALDPHFGFDSGKFNSDSAGRNTAYTNEINAATDNAALKRFLPGATPDQLYQFMKEWQSGGKLDTWGRPVPVNNFYQGHIDRYDAAQNNFKPTRKVKV